MRKVHWVSSSSDSKIGSIPASYSTIDSCPDSCSMKSGGCYAWGLFYLKILSGKIDRGAIKTMSLADALKKRSLSARVVRHRVAGDVVGDVKETLDECKLVESNNLINIGYTHDWRNPETQPLKKYFRASCNSLSDLRQAHSMGWSTTLVVDGNVPKVSNIEGKKAILCPARHNVPGKKDITCNDCTLCKVTDKTSDTIVLFKIHGSKSTLNKLSGKSVTLK
jgi:hypothetical protein